MSPNRPPTVAAATLGCRLNQYETEKMVAELLQVGFDRVEDSSQADLYLINTCTVTHRADASSRQLINRIASAKAESTVVVAGCYVDSDPARVSGLAGVDLVVPNAQKAGFVERLRQFRPELFFSAKPPSCETATAEFFPDQHRAWLKVSDGCNQWCSFCIIPQVRGRLRNRSPLELLAEVHGLAAKGFQEIVLTGINVGHYSWRSGDPQLKNLADLCRFLASESDLRRFRISSIEPQSVRTDLIEWYASQSSRLCRHWHLPLQSGSSRILKAMQRPYNAEMFIAKAEQLKAARPNTIIGADVIVGFPGESEDDFAKTVAIAESGLLDYLHVFSYSDRRNTAATRLPEKVRPEIIKDRTAQLNSISKLLRARAHARQVGQILPVIAEDYSVDKQFQTGVSDNFLKVRMPQGHVWGREIVNLCIESASNDYVTGSEIVSTRSDQAGQQSCNESRLFERTSASI